MDKTEDSRLQDEEAFKGDNWAPPTDQENDQGMAISVERALRRVFSEWLRDDTEQSEKTQ